MNRSTENPKAYLDYQIKVSLNPCLCDKTFKDVLRSPKGGYKETLMTDVKEQFRFKRDQTSHVFGGEENAKEPSHKPMKYVKSKVMFNDFYVEANPRIVTWRTVRYDMEKRSKTMKRLHSDDHYMTVKKRPSLTKKLKDTYSRNPIEILNTEQTMRLNRKNRASVEKRTEAIGNYLGSRGVRRNFRSLVRDIYLTEKMAKVTNENYGLITSTIQRNKKEDNHKTRHYRISSVDGKAFTYF